MTTVAVEVLQLRTNQFVKGDHRVGFVLGILADGEHHFFDLVFEDAGVERLLVFEVEVDGAGRELRLPGDLTDSRGVVAFSGEHAFGTFENGEPAGLQIAFFAGDLPGGEFGLEVHFFFGWIAIKLLDESLFIFMNITSYFCQVSAI